MAAQGRAFLAREGITPIPLAPYAAFRRACPPLCEQPIRMPPRLGGDLWTYLWHVSMLAYFRVVRVEGGFGLTDDDLRNESYHNRQYMLFSAYRHYVGDALRAISLLDLAGSNGYFSFHAARLGFGRLLCVDNRAEHARQHAFLQSLLPDIHCDFDVVDVERLPAALLAESFDVVLAQGILYHLYDQLAFLRHVREMTRRLLILDTQLNGRMDRLLTLRRERGGHARYSNVTGLALAPSLPALVALLQEAGFRSLRVVPFPSRARDERGRSLDGSGYRAYRRIMIAAEP